MNKDIKIIPTKLSLKNKFKHEKMTVHILFQFHFGTNFLF
jgi:hypothetical protein